MANPVSPRPKQRAWGRLILVSALVLSLLGNALAIGAWARFRMVRAELLGPIATTERLPDELRSELRQALRADPRRSLPLLRDVVRARAAIVAAATADPFDRAAAERAMTDFRQAIDALLVEVQDVLLDHLDERPNP